MPNINKVVYGNQTLLDLTDTTAEASDVAQGKYFYGRDGVKTEGTATGGGGDVSHHLPSAYQEVRYIIGNASGAVIDTGVTPDETTYATFKVTPLAVTGEALLGTKGANDNADWRVFNYSSNIYWDCYSARLNGGSMPVNTAKELTVKNNQVIDVETGSVLLSGTTVSSFSIPYNIFINGASSTNTVSATWFYVQIYKGGSKVRDFIPCYRKSDDVVGMYDLVNSSFYTSAGSGSFTAGPDIVPSGGGSTLVTKTITANGTYDASSDNADGYSSVTVNVPSGITVATTQDEHGGDIVTITAVDISDTTAVASDVASGKYFYTAAGVKTAGTASGGGGATQHTIHLEFTDSTDADIDVYYDDSLLGTMITAYDPVTYGNKTVDSAALDNVVWYQRPTVTWETLWENNETNFISDTPYNYMWLSSLSNVYPTAGSVWRVTIDNSTYQCTAASASTSGGNITCFGNPKYSGGTDNGSDAPFNMYNAGWGALMGDTEVTAGNHYMKIERQVSA